jgi:site-specific recombinase XerC
MTTDIEEFLSEYQPAHSSYTRNLYRSLLRRYHTFLEVSGLTVDKARRTHMREFVDWMKELPNSRTGLPGMSDSTIRTSLSAVRSYYRWLKAHNRAERNPGTGFRYRGNLKPRRVRAVSSQTISLMCKNSGRKRDTAICRLLHDSGLRLVELVRLNKDSIQILRINGPKGFSHMGITKVLRKGNKIRTVAISERALQAIGDYLDERGEDTNPALFVSRLGRRISTRAVQRLIDAMSVKIGAGHAHPHQLRHSFSESLSNSGLPEAGIQKRMGHDRLQTTHVYIETSLKNAMAQYRRAATANRMAQGTRPGQTFGQS